MNHKINAINVIIILILALAMAGSVNAGIANCDSCSNCSDAAVTTGTTINVTANLVVASGDCIVFNPGGSLTLECNNFNITGSMGGSRAMLLVSTSSNTVRNCNIMNFTSAIYVFGGGADYVYNNTFTQNTYGVNFQGGTGKQIFRNSMYSNDYGIFSAASGGQTHNMSMNNIYNNSVKNIYVTTPGQWWATQDHFIDGNYWGHSVPPFYNCTLDSNIGNCEAKNDTSPYGQMNGWNLRSTLNGTSFTSLPANTGGNYSSLHNISLSGSGSAINFTQPIDFHSAANLDNYISLGLGFVSIDSSGLGVLGNDFNRTARITLHVNGCDNLFIKHASTYYTTLNDIMANGQNCTSSSTPSCTNIVCSGTELSFDVQHFDGYGGGGNPFVPEFSTLTLMLAMVIVIAGFFAMRKTRP